jgi:hypothetical protein
MIGNVIVIARLAPLIVGALPDRALAGRVMPDSDRCIAWPVAGTGWMPLNVQFRRCITTGYSELRGSGLRSRRVDN